MADMTITVTNCLARLFFTSTQLFTPSPLKPHASF